MVVNQLKAGAVLNYVVIGLNSLVGLLYTPYMLRMMGQSEYGLYSLVASVIAYLTIMDFGFGNAIIRYTAKFRAEGRQQEQYAMFGMFLILYSVIGILAFGAGLGLYFNVEALFGDTMTVVEVERAKVLMIILIFNLAVTFPLSIFGAVVTAYEDFIFQKVVQIVRRDDLFVENGVSGCSDGSRANAVQSRYTVVELLLLSSQNRDTDRFRTFSLGVSPGSDRLFVLDISECDYGPHLLGYGAVCVGSHRRHRSRGRFCRSDLPERYVLFVFDLDIRRFPTQSYGNDHYRRVGADRIRSVYSYRTYPVHRTGICPVCFYSVGAAVYRVVGRRRV